LSNSSKPRSAASSAKAARGAKPVRIGIVVGEVSGDLLAAGLMRELKRRLPRVTFEGIAGPRMQAEGCVSLYPMESLSHIGFEVLKHYPALSAMRRRLAEHFLRSPPDLYIGVDTPDFNLWIEERLKARGIPTVHYVSPTVWAWRRWRIRRIHRAVDRMLTLFPFEARYYRDHHVPVTYVGHPLADKLEPPKDISTIRERLRLPVRFRIVALLPGSRIGELRRHADLFVQAAQWLSARHPNIRFVVPFASPETRVLFEQALRRHAVDEQIFRLLDHASRDAMAVADAVLLASGTATLEAALLGKPMVVTYRVSWFSYFLIRLFAHVRLYALPNHLAGRALVPEFMQADAVPEKLGRAVERYLEHPREADAVTRALNRIRRSLRRNADVRAAEAVLGLLRTRRGRSRPRS